MTKVERFSVYKNGFFRGIKPDPLITVSEWADENRYLSQRSSAEPGRWRTSRTPYLGEIMDCLSSTSEIEKVVVMSGSQIGKSETGNNWIGYVIDRVPGPMLCVQPTVEMAKRYSKQRIDPLIVETPKLAEKVRPQRERDSGNTILSKEFPGGIVVITGANSAVGLRSLPARYLFCDEVDSYPGDVDNEGDPVSLAEARTRTFARRKILLTSTPTIEGRSRIQSAFEEGDRRRFHVPCPQCGGAQVLKFLNLKYENNDPETAYYVCEHNGCVIEEHQKTKMLDAGRWIPELPGAGGGKLASFHINSLYSPMGWYSWRDIISDWLKAKGHHEKLRTFVNTVLGETWKEKGDTPDWRRLYDRRETYQLNSLPEGVMFLVCGVDVQKDRLEAQIVGWGKDKESWSIDYRVFPGDTSDLSAAGPWPQVDELLQEQWQVHGSNVQIPLRMCAIDSGYNTQTVYDFVRRYPANRVIATKGMDHLQMIVGQPSSVDIATHGKRIRRGLRVWPVGVSTAKSELYGILKMDRPTDKEIEETGFPPGFVHFPQYGEEFFRQLTAEQLMVRIVKGFRRYEWEKIYERNEALDTFILCRAAASIIGIDRFTDDHWNNLRTDLGPILEKNAPLEVKSENKQEKPAIPRRKSTYW